MGFLSLNIQYIRSVNACKYKELSEFFLNLLDVPKAFTSKRYIWNWIRGKDFYKTISLITINLAKDFLQHGTEENLVKIERFIRIVMSTEPNESVRKSFVWNITKSVPILTVDTIQYMSAERIANIVQSDEKIIFDDHLCPIMQEIIRLKKDLEQSEQLVAQMLNLTDE